MEIPDFERHRPQLHRIAYRLLGSSSEADDAVQETWLRLNRSDAAGIENLVAWLQTVVSRICLDMLRARAARREEPWDVDAQKVVAVEEPEQEAVRADSVGRALLVVLAMLSPAERVAFVLHDLFAVPFREIAPILDRTPDATKKLASRARHRVTGPPLRDPAAVTDVAVQREVVGAFLAAARNGDVAALLAVLAPDVVRRIDADALGDEVATLVRGARAVADETALLSPMSQSAELVMVDGTVGIVVAPLGRLLLVLKIAVRDGRVAAYDVVADSDRLARLQLTVLPA